jgi:hypothetical protein
MEVERSLDPITCVMGVGCYAQIPVMSSFSEAVGFSPAKSDQTLEDELCINCIVMIGSDLPNALPQGARSSVKTQCLCPLRRRNIR